MYIDVKMGRCEDVMMICLDATMRRYETMIYVDVKMRKLWG